MILRRLAIVLIALLPSAAAADNAAAVVAKYLPPKAEHTIDRTVGGEAIAGLGTPLYAGDRITVSAGGSLDIAYADGARESLTGPVTFVVPEKEPIGMAARIYDRLQVILGRKYRQGNNLATRNPGSCATDTPPLDAPALRPTTYLIAGHENVALAWIGGCPPYSIRFHGPAGADVRVDDLKRPLTRIDTHELPAGEYSLNIGDARSQQIVASVILASDLPDGPFPSAGIGSELDAVAFAAWLANHEDGRWRLESFQQLRPWIRAGGVMAGTYGDLVMWGDPVLEADAAN